MAWKYSNEKPIFQQIVDYMTNDIVSGKFHAGDKLPTVRELSIVCGANPNTVQRAYAEIEQMGLIYTKRGDGRYVCEDTLFIENQAKYQLSETVTAFIMSLKQMGFDDDEIFDAVKFELERGKNNV